MKTLEEIKRTFDGGRIIAEWLGAGGRPVPQMIAEIRSHVCEVCAKNVEPNWWDRIKSKIAGAIKEMLHVKNECGYRVSNEDKLAMCSACGCANSLSVFTPIQHISSHTDADTFYKFTKECWKRKELSGFAKFSQLHD